MSPMLAYAVFPAWETPRLRERLAAWLAANGCHAAAVLRHFAEPTAERRADMRSAQLASRRARAAWQEAYDRAQQEPARPRGLTAQEAKDAQEALKGIDRAATLMESRVPHDDNPSAPRWRSWPKPWNRTRSRRQPLCASTGTRTGHAWRRPSRHGKEPVSGAQRYGARQTCRNTPWKTLRQP